MTPPPIPRRQRPAIAGIWHLLLPLLLLLPANLAARQPWWNEEKIITGATPDDYAAANVGQLKTSPPALQMRWTSGCSSLAAAVR